MRTTLDIDDDLMQAAKELARRQGVSAGTVVSRLVRTALLASDTRGQVPAGDPARPASKLGFRPLQHGEHVVTNEVVNQLRESEGI